MASINSHSFPAPLLPSRPPDLSNLSPCYLSCPCWLYSLAAKWSFKNKNKILLFPYLKPPVASRCIQNKCRKLSIDSVADSRWQRSFDSAPSECGLALQLCVTEIGRSNVLWLQESHQESWSLGQGLLWEEPVFMKGDCRPWDSHDATWENNKALGEASDVKRHVERGQGVLRHQTLSEEIPWEWVL